MARTYQCDPALIDYSTLNMARVKDLPVYHKPPTYEISRHMGQGCAFDAPGYPRYFLQAVYTQYGNDPRGGPVSVIRSDDGMFNNATGANMRRLWLPLPEDHPRVQTWLATVYKHFQHCYHDPSQPRHNDLMFWPIPDYTLDKIAIADHFPSERFIGWLIAERPDIVAHWQADTDIMLATTSSYNDVFRRYMRTIYPDVIAAYDALNDAVVKPLHDAYIAAKQHLVTPNNHQAVRWARKFYPEHQPRVEWIETPPCPVQNDWWQRYASEDIALQAGVDIA